MQFGNWTFIKDLGTRLSGKRYRRYYLVKCSCGYEKEIAAQSLKNGLSKGCQTCHCRKVQKHVKHNLCNTIEYRAWGNLISRCYNQNHQAYKNYGGRGIKVCASWRDKTNGFSNFLADMGKRPSAKHSIDRINNDGNYEPGNCRWATAKQQRNNQRKAA